MNDADQQLARTIADLPVDATATEVLVTVLPRCMVHLLRQVTLLAIDAELEGAATDRDEREHNIPSRFRGGLELW